MKKVLFLSTILLWISGVAWAQTRQVTGQVLNSESNEVLTDVSVTVKGTARGVVTGKDGKFSINIPSEGNTILAITSVGFTPQEVRVANRANLQVKLVSENKALDNVVVVGYGTVKKKILPVQLVLFSHRTLSGPILQMPHRHYRGR